MGNQGWCSWRAACRLCQASTSPGVPGRTVKGAGVDGHSNEQQAAASWGAGRATCFDCTKPRRALQSGTSTPRVQVALGPILTIFFLKLEATNLNLSVVSHQHSQEKHLSTIDNRLSSTAPPGASEREGCSQPRTQVRRMLVPRKNSSHKFNTFVSQLPSRGTQQCWIHTRPPPRRAPGAAALTSLLAY